MMPLESVFNNLATLVISVASDNSVGIKTTLPVECPEKVKSSGNAQNKDELNLNPGKDMSDTECQNKKKLAKKRWKCANHVKVNASERERKGRLAASIQKLKDVIPISSQKMQTKENVLEEALGYISNLKEKMEDMLQKDSSENMVTEMKSLRKKICDLENEKSLYLRVLQSHGLLHMLKSKQVKNPTLPIPRLHRAKENVSSQLPTSTAVEKNSSDIPTSSCVATATSVTNVPTTLLTRASSVASLLSNFSNSEAASTCLASTASPLSPCCNALPISSSQTDVCISQSSGKFAFPSINALYPQSSKALCTLTYSLARMSGSVAPDIPKLPCVAAVRLCQESNGSAEEKGTKKQLTAKEIQTSSPSPMSSAQEQGVVSPRETLAKNSDHAKYASVSDLNDVSNQHPVSNSNIPGAVASFSSPELASSLSNTTSVESLQTLLESLSSSKSKAATDCSASASLATTPERHLMSWLRSHESPDPLALKQTIIPKHSLDSGQAEIDNQSVVSAQYSRKSSSHNSSFHGAKTQASKKDTNSFNIASLMKSKAAITTQQSPTTSRTMSSVFAHQTNSSKESSMLQMSLDNPDFNSATPKDMFHNSFENEILDCLQNIPSLTTPDPITRQPCSKPDAFDASSTFACTTEYSYIDPNNPGRLSNSEMKGQRAQSASMDFSDVQLDTLHRAQSRTAVYEKRVTDEQHSMDHPYSDPTSQCVDTSIANVRGKPPWEAKNKQQMTFGKYNFSNQSSTPNLNYVPNSTAVSLWQPAITSTPPPRQIITSLPTIPNCFSPMAYQYLNTNTPRLSHPLCSGQQVLPSYKTNPSWMSNPAPGGRYSVMTSTKASDQSSGVETKKNKLDTLKKRKAPRNVTQHSVKRKKSHTKSFPSATRQDPHSIPQLMGYQHATKIPQHSQVFMTHAGTLLHPNRINGSCANNPTFNSNEKGAIFGTSTSNVMCPPGVGYNGDYGAKSNLFHSPPPVTPQTPSYHAPHGSYHFTYSHPVGHQQPAKHMYMPRFANTNNSNSASPLVVDKQPKSSQSQHHIRQILS